MLQSLGISKITVPLPFRLDHVHCFLAEGNDGYTMVDTGLHNQETIDLWEEILGNKPVERILLTHLHPDHCGYAGVLQAQTGATVWMTETDALSLRNMWMEESIPYLEADYEHGGVPAEIAEGIIQLTKQFQPFVTPTPNVDTYITDGQHIQLGKEVFEVIFTPGHAAGLICLFHREKGILLSTDHILPKITPNIAYWFYGEKNPLQSFETSLKKVRKLDAEYVIPSHGEPFRNANQRIDELWKHHEIRLDQTMRAAKNGITIFALCDVLFTRKLSVYDYQFAVGEAMAHLEYLRAKNMLERVLYQGKWLYQPC